MVKFKLRYLSNYRGRGEVARLLFALANEEFEEELIDYHEFAKHRPTTPFGQLPVLEVDGEQICQSNAINRFLANRFGFAGNTTMNKARADMIVDCVEDIILGVLIIMRVEEWTEENKKQRKAEYAWTKVPDFLVKLENLLKQNNAGRGFFVGDTITWADLTVYHWCYELPNFGVEINLDGLPVLKSLIGRVGANPQIAAYLKKRTTLGKS